MQPLPLLIHLLYDRRILLTDKKVDKYNEIENGSLMHDFQENLNIKDNFKMVEILMKSSDNPCKHCQKQE